MRGIGKTFPGVRALDGVDFTVAPGEIHALVGENGAGKSTLLNILGGTYPAGTYTGELRMNGQTCSFRSVADAEHAGLAVVHQELSLVGPLTIAQNICLGHEPHTAGLVWRDTERLLARDALALLHSDLDPDTIVERLGIGHQQMVEIAKALARKARVLVLDEPTAALSDADADVLLDLLERLRAQRLGIVYVSHRLDEVLRIADRVTVLRDGRSVRSSAARDVDAAALVAAMVGRDIDALFPHSTRTPGAVVLSASHVSVEDPHVAGRHVVRDVSFEVRAGEVVGIAGLVGAGRSELLMALFGAAAGRCHGAIAIDGVPLDAHTPRVAIDRGMALLGEDRKQLGLLLGHSIADNVVLPVLSRLAERGVLSSTRVRAVTNKAIRTLGVRPADPDERAGALSGGNQQKVLLGRWLETGPRVLLLDEPTRGIDIGARQEIYALIDRLAAGGLAILVVSSDLPEVLGLADRVLVMRLGRLTAEFSRQTATPETVMAAATGV
jgi:D-xylose transport system ATP-binding protein